MLFHNLLHPYQCVSANKSAVVARYTWSRQLCSAVSAWAQRRGYGGRCLARGRGSSGGGQRYVPRTAFSLFGSSAHARTCAGGSGATLSANHLREFHFLLFIQAVNACNGFEQISLFFLGATCQVRKHFVAFPSHLARPDAQRRVIACRVTTLHSITIRLQQPLLFYTTRQCCMASRVSSPLWNCCSLTWVTQWCSCRLVSQKLLFAKGGGCQL